MAAGGGGLSHSSGDQGWYNTALGADAATSITGGDSSAVVGAGALLGGIRHNVAVGYQAMPDAETPWLTAVGSQAMHSQESGTGNTAVGYMAVEGNMDYYSNTGMGSHAAEGCYWNTNTALGYLALETCSAGAENCARLCLPYAALDPIIPRRVFVQCAAHKALTGA